MFPKKEWVYGPVTVALVVALALAGCGGGGGGGGGAGGASSEPASDPTVSARVVFSGGFQGGDVFSASESGDFVAALADTLDYEQVATWLTTYDATSTEAGASASGSAYVTSDRQPMVRNGRAIYQRFPGGSPFGSPGDIYAVNLDGTQRVALAATANDEIPFVLVADRLIYTSRSATALTTNIRSIRLDGSGDTAITNITDPQQPARPIGFTGTRVIFTEGVSGTYISDTDGGNRVTLWNQAASEVLVSGNRLLLVAGELISAVNTDGTAFVSLTTQANQSGKCCGIFPSSLGYGVAAGRVFYRSFDQSTSPPTYRLHSVGLDGADPLVLSTSTASPYVMARAGTRLIVDEEVGDRVNVVSYDIAQPNSRTPLLADHNFMLVAQGRVVGFKPSGTNFDDLTISSVNPDGTAAATLAQGAIPVGSVNVVRLANNQIVYKKAAPSGRIEGYAVNLDGSGTTALTNAIAGDKDLLDIVAGRLIFESFPTGQPTATRNLHSVLLTGAGGLDYATTAADERYLGAFGDKLLFTSRLSDGGAQDLKLVPTAGGAAVLLQSSPEQKFFVGAY